MRFDDRASQSVRDSLLSFWTSRHLTTLKRDDTMLFELREGVSVKDAVEAMRKDAHVVWAQPDYIYRIADYPEDEPRQASVDDPQFGELWGLENTGQTVTNGGSEDNPPTDGAGKDMNAKMAWTLQSDCSSVIVAVTDTGVNYTHEDLADNMWTNPDEIPGNGLDDDNNGFIDDVYGADWSDNDGDPMDTDGHGTHVAGTIGAVGNNAKGITGVCQKAKIMALRTLGGGSGSSSSIAASLDYAVAKGAKVVNMSLGGTDAESVEDLIFKKSIYDAKMADVLLVIAAGNDASNNDEFTHTPCTYDYYQEFDANGNEVIYSKLDNIVCIAALTQDYNLASFSDWGLYTVEAGAPGRYTTSAWYGTSSGAVEDYSTGWNNTGGWTAQTCTSLNSGSVYTVLNPSTWCGPGTWIAGPYANNISETTWKDFTVNASAPTVELSYYLWYDLELWFDFLQVYYKPGGGDPFSGGKKLDIWTGSSGTGAGGTTYALPDCIGQTTCSVGFKIVTDEDTTGAGVAILWLSVGEAVIQNDAYATISGTSMATPHAAGLAALIWAYQPSFTYSDVAGSLIWGGDSIPALQGKTVTGKAIDAYGSLLYVNRVRNVTATQ